MSSAFDNDLMGFAVDTEKLAVKCEWALELKAHAFHIMADVAVFRYSVWVLATA